MRKGFAAGGEALSRFAGIGCRDGGLVSAPFRADTEGHGAERSQEVLMGSIGVSISVFTIGAILTFAIKADAIEDSVNLNAIGIILMLVGLFMFGLQWVVMSRASKQSSEREEDRDELFDEDRPPKP
jgi:hypothetical protein